jgi:hypothetical protein
MSTDTALHIRLSREKAAAAKNELGQNRHTAVGDLAIKAVEQAIEAAASLQGIHFHIEPRRAHAERLRWAKEKFAGISADLDELWGAYGALGYEGVNGERAKRAVKAMERAISRIATDSNLKLV